jgi:hypothetical protein
VVREALWCWQHGVPYADARERVTRIYWNEQPCNAIPNHGFMIIGWLYGEDFGDGLCKAVNCGFDTDCTGATLGSVLGILGGTAAIPREWGSPVGTDIVLHEYTVDVGVPKTLSELTDRTVALGERFAVQRQAAVVIGEQASYPDDLLGRLHRNEKASEALRQDIRCGSVLVDGLEVYLHYNGDPVLRPHVTRRMHVTCRKDGHPVGGRVGLEGPADWLIQPVPDSDPPGFDVAALSMEGAQSLHVVVEVDGRSYRAAFTVLSPQEAQGYPNAVQSTQWSPGMAVRCHSPRLPGISFD